jgi:LPS-assembly protein
VPLREPGLRISRAQLPSAPTDLGTDPGAASLQLNLSLRLSAPPKAPEHPGWALHSARILLDFDKQEGVAEDAQLRLLGVPVLSLPRVSFPLGEERRSGWLAPTARADTRGGFEVSAPYYVNLAPNQDLTITPAMATRRGPSVELEARHLGTQAAGVLLGHWVPRDQQRSDARGAVYWQGQWQGTEWSLASQGLRTSDDDYWKDFGHTQTFRRQTIGALERTNGLSDWTEGRTLPTLQPRLLSQQIQAEHRTLWGETQWLSYARMQSWQALQGTDPNGQFLSPFQRSPQVGVQVDTRLGAGVDLSLETEVNRFTRPDGVFLSSLPWREGVRWHALASISRPWVGPGTWVIPRLSLNTAVYDAQAASNGNHQRFDRTIPTLSVDSGAQWERHWEWGSRSFVQTLEPRIVYVNTPTRDQRNLPNFDAAAKEFNSTSIFSENAFSGIDRVSDAHQVTIGLTTRSLDTRTGAEWIRASLAQRIQFRDQFTTPSGTVSNQRLSDILFASTVVLSPTWGVDATVQYNPDLQRTVRSVVAMRYYPKPGSTLIAAYRFARDTAETMELRANWPIWRSIEPSDAFSDGVCTRMITGAARVNYNTRESRIADSLYGLEVDSGCWTLRLGLQRQSTGVAEEVTRLILQLELAGLTRARLNPLRF